MRVIDPSSTNKDGSACKKDEKALDFNQTGPPGQQGPTGATGPTGPSDVYSVDGYDAGQKNLPIQTWEVLATTPTLPAGSYVVQGEAEMQNITSLDTNYSCDLVDSSTNEYQSERGNGPDWVTLPVQSVITLASPDTISLRCIAADQANSQAFNWKLTALEVGTVHS
jgi:hypothetical protein